MYTYYKKESLQIKMKMYIKQEKTKQINNKRFHQYPKKSILIYQILCDDCDELERSIIINFKLLFKRRSDIGNEYFEGDKNVMIKSIHHLMYNDAKIVNLDLLNKNETNIKNVN